MTQHIKRKMFFLAKPGHARDAPRDEPVTAGRHVPMIASKMNTLETDILSFLEQLMTTSACAI